MQSTAEIMNVKAPARSERKPTKRTVKRDREKQRRRERAVADDAVRMALGLRGMSVGQAHEIFVPPHFVARFRERVPSTADPVLVGRGIVWAISNHRTDLFEFLGRTIPHHRRRYRFKTPDGHAFVALVDTDAMVPITVLTEDE